VKIDYSLLKTTIMNKHLNDLMEGLTAKVFRTFNASNTLQEQLDKLTDPKSSVTEKVVLKITSHTMLVLILFL
jgi:DNA topoisomerase-1